MCAERHLAIVWPTLSARIEELVANFHFVLMMADKDVRWAVGFAVSSGRVRKITVGAVTFGVSSLLSLLIGLAAYME